MSDAFDIRQETLARRSLGARGDLICDQYGNLKVSMPLPPMVELALAGKTFTANTKTGTFIAPATAPLTTNAQHVLYNSSSGSVYLILMSAAIWLESGTRAIGSSVFGAVTTAAESTAPSAYTNSANGAFGGHSNSGVGVYDAGVTLDAAPVWFALAANDTLADANESSGIVVDLFSRGIIVPPGLLFAMSIRNSGAGTTPLFGASFTWAELALDN
jgi:hypothetical protein